MGIVKLITASDYSMYSCRRRNTRAQAACCQTDIENEMTLIVGDHGLAPIDVTFFSSYESMAK